MDWLLEQDLEWRKPYFLRTDVDVLTDFTYKVRGKSKEFSNKLDLFIKIPYFVIKILKFEIFYCFFG